MAKKAEGHKVKGWPNRKDRAVDEKWDKAHHIKEGSWQDKAIDAAAKKRDKR